jgi:hypothetical protein
MKISIVKKLIKEVIREVIEENTIPSGVWWPKPNDKIIFEIGTGQDKIIAKYKNVIIGTLNPKDSTDTSTNAYHVFKATDPRFLRLNGREGSLKVLHAYLTRIVELQIER